MHMEICGLPTMFAKDFGILKGEDLRSCIVILHSGK